MSPTTTIEMSPKIAALSRKSPNRAPLFWPLTSRSESPTTDIEAPGASVAAIHDLVS